MNKSYRRGVFLFQTENSSSSSVSVSVSISCSSAIFVCSKFLCPRSRQCLYQNETPVFIVKENTQFCLIGHSGLQFFYKFPKPVIIIFRDCFLRICSDTLPIKLGTPNFSYLSKCSFYYLSPLILIFSNKKCTLKNKQIRYCI